MAESLVRDRLSPILIQPHLDAMDRRLRQVWILRFCMNVSVWRLSFLTRFKSSSLNLNLDLSLVLTAACCSPAGPEGGVRVHWKGRIQLRGGGRPPAGPRSQRATTEVAVRGGSPAAGHMRIPWSQKTGLSSVQSVELLNLLTWSHVGTNPRTWGERCLDVETCWTWLDLMDTNLQRQTGDVGQIWTTFTPPSSSSSSPGLCRTLWWQTVV